MVVGDRPCIGQLVHAYNQTHGSVVAVMEVPHEETQRYGVIAGEEVEGALNHGRLHKVSRLVEKPRPADAPSNLAIIGRYVLTPKIFDKLEQTQSGAGGEIQLTDAIEALMQEQAVYGYEFEGTRYDCGTTMGWLKASVELALQRTGAGPRSSGPTCSGRSRRLRHLASLGHVDAARLIHDRRDVYDAGDGCDRPRPTVGPTTTAVGRDVEPTARPPRSGDAQLERRSGRSSAAATGSSSCSDRAAWPGSTAATTTSSTATSPSSSSGPSTAAIPTSARASARRPRTRPR